MKSLVTKMSLVMLGGVLPVPVVSERWLEVMPKIVTRQASENPIAFYKHFLETTVLPNSNRVRSDDRLGGDGGGNWADSGPADRAWRRWWAWFWWSTTVWRRSGCLPGQQGFHLVLFFLMLAFFFARAGRTWGLDGWLARRNPRSLLARRPLS